MLTDEEIKKIDTCISGNRKNDGFIIINKCLRFSSEITSHIHITQHPSTPVYCKLDTTHTVTPFFRQQYTIMGINVCFNAHMNSLEFHKHAHT